MVNFDNETTVATPAKDVMKIYLLQCKAFVEDVWRNYRKADFAGANPGLFEVRSALEQLYLVMEPMIERHWDDQEIKKEDILHNIEHAKKDSFLKLIIKFNKVLDKTKLTRIDTKFEQKKTWEASNIQHGY